MKIFKLSEADRRNSRNLVTRIGAGEHVLDIFESLHDLVSELKKSFNYKHCAYNICNDGNNELFDEFDPNRLDYIIANMLLDSFYSADVINALAVKVSYGKQQRMYRLMGEDEPLSPKTKLTDTNQFVVITSNGVLRLLNVDETRALSDEQYEEMYKEDQII
jgi:hypothetical protein